MHLSLILVSLPILLSSSVPSFAESGDISEFPDSRPAFVSELKVRNDEMRTCKERKECVFLMEYTKVLRSHIETLSDGTKELAYIEKTYGKDSYDWIMKNRDSIDLKFDEHFTAWILRKTGGKMLVEDHGFSKREISDTYKAYVVEEALPELYELRKKAKSLRMKALYSYGVYFLMSDTRLFDSGK